MGANGWKGKLYWFVEFVTMLAVLQLMWIGLTLMGLVVLGISPATVGLFVVMRKRMQGQDDLRSLTADYWKTYKAEFVNSNKIGLVIMVIGYFLILNLRLVLTMGGTTGFAMVALMVMLSILYAVMVMNIFQVFAHYDLPFSRYFSASLLLSISFPVQAIGSMMGLYVLYRIFLYIPGLLPFFGVSVTILFLTWMSSQVFRLKGESDGTFQVEESK
ncbi:YesL family protein [Sporosarcina sp. NPDC096371]|uniref:YesL family protein n=1 Tax=Sporosarcina sp. NPDC096371 TaxID=3364530 RepID=UPI0037F7D8C6